MRTRKLPFAKVLMGIRRRCTVVGYGVNVVRARGERLRRAIRRGNLGFNSCTAIVRPISERKRQEFDEGAVRIEYGVLEECLTDA